VYRVTQYLNGGSCSKLALPLCRISENWLQRNFRRERVRARV